MNALKGASRLNSIERAEVKELIEGPAGFWSKLTGTWKSYNIGKNRVSFMTVPVSDHEILICGGIGAIGNSV